MALQFGENSIVSAVDAPPGRAGQPYVISSQEGELIYVPFSRALTRLLLTARETDYAFAVVGRSGSHGDVTGFYSHRRAHVVVICLKGSMRFWINDQCRTMTAGDCVSVPPDTAKQYQLLGDHSESISFFSPGGGEDFFRFVGEPTSGPFWPLQDNRDASEALGYKVSAAMQRYSMQFHHDYKSAEPSLWRASDAQLPGRLSPYFLRSASGPAYLIGGTVCRPLITCRESNNQFTVGSIEGSSHHFDNYVFGKTGMIQFAEAQHAFLIVEGVVEFVIGSCLPALLPAGQVIFVPRRTEFSIHFRARFAKMYAFASGAGLIGLSCSLGDEYDLPMPPNRSQPVDIRALQALQYEFGFQLC